MKTDAQTQSAYRYCRHFAKSHYENFPVASLLMPKRLRDPVAAIYTFARLADDIADEGDAAATERLEQLNKFQQQLDAISNNQTTADALFWVALADSIQRFQLPVSLFEDLLHAFRQDVCKKRYANLTELLDYCRYSANPVGRLLLHLNGQPTQTQLHQSDCICTALQLINFFQDIEQDYLEKNRIYLPQDRLGQVGVEESELLGANTTRLASILRPLYQYTMDLMQQGLSLGTTLNGRLGWEVRAMTLGGIKALILLMQQPDNQLLSRPRLSKKQHTSVLINAVSKRRYLLKTSAFVKPFT